MDRVTRVAAMAAFVCALAACGGSPSGQTAAASPSAAASGAAAQAVTGVSTPTSVSVVTAKNAQ